MYSNGRSEEIIGKALKEFNIPRRKVVILTKCWGVVNEHNGAQAMPNQPFYQSKDYVNQFGGSSGWHSL
jgi:aryl-alcohol dehydrogenase-like predicted oxidoreductase